MHQVSLNCQPLKIIGLKQIIYLFLKKQEKTINSLGTSLLISPLIKMSGCVYIMNMQFANTSSISLSSLLADLLTASELLHRMASVYEF